MESLQLASELPVPPKTPQTLRYDNEKISDPQKTVPLHSSKSDIALDIASTEIVTPTNTVKRKASQGLLKKSSEVKRRSLATDRPSGLHPSVSTPFKSPFPVNPALKSSVKTTTPAVKSFLMELGGTVTPASKPISRLRPSTPNIYAPGTSASKPFKSPLLKSSTSNSTPGSSQKKDLNLERKLHTLRQAYKIHSSTSKNSEQSLVESISKWRKVARDAAEELWLFMKDSEGISHNDSADQSANTSTASTMFSESHSSPTSWGWDRPEESSVLCNDEQDDIDHEFESFSPPSPSVITAELLKQSKNKRLHQKATSSRKRESFTSWADSNCSPDWDDEPSSKSKQWSEESEWQNSKQPKSPEWGIGLMLSQLNIPAELLGWNEEEGEFTGP